MSEDYYNYEQPYKRRFLAKKSPFWLHIILFVITFISTSIAGVMWANKPFNDLSNISYGLTYAILIMTFLLSHEMGHYIASKIHKVDASLPYFIPFPPTELTILSFGTMGAVIKTHSPIPSRKALFDIGVAGPLAGFIVCLIFLIYGLVTLPPKEFIYQIHPEYLIMYNGNIPTTSLHFGDTLLFTILSKLFANPNGWLPPMNEIYHYPFLNVGWFGLFVTTLNMLPLGQLDGGHVTYAMFGRFQSLLARIFWWILIILGIGGFLSFLGELFQVDSPNSIYLFFQRIMLPFIAWLKSIAPWFMSAWGGWLFWAFITKVFIKLDHPPIADMYKLDKKRMIIGWIALVILLLSFSYNGIYFVE
ncbi:MAG: site-2 protease family protein [Candidatus Woesearchaeota archaeon]